MRFASFRKERRMRHQSTELMGTIKAFVEEYVSLLALMFGKEMFSLLKVD